jgi:S-adenosylmethionine synthetase, central domain
VVVSVQHSDKVSLEQLREEVENKVIRSVIPSKYIDDQTVFHINPCGEFIVGGPQVISLIFVSLNKFFFYKSKQSMSIGYQHQK